MDGPVVDDKISMSDAGRVIRRRRVPRRDFHRRVGLLIRGQYLISRAAQLGEGGMMVYSPTPLKLGQAVVVSFKLPDKAPDIVRAVVRYILPPERGQGPRYGIEFANLDFNVKRDIRNYVAAKSAAEDSSAPH